MDCVTDISIAEKFTQNRGRYYEGVFLFVRSDAPAHSKEDRFVVFERISEREGVLDTMYQRSKIQDESILYEH